MLDRMFISAYINSVENNLCNLIDFHTDFHNTHNTIEHPIFSPAPISMLPSFFIKQCSDMLYYFNKSAVVGSVPRFPATAPLFFKENL